MALPVDYYTKVATVPYPPICTNKGWQKKKSFLDKAMDATKTGLGAELVKAEAAYNKIEFAKLHAAAQGPWRADIQIEVAKIQGERHYDAVVKPAIKVFDRAAKVALQVSINTDLSKSARAAAKLIADTLEGHADVWRKVDFDDFDAELDHRKQLLAMALAPLKANVAELERRLRALAQAPLLAGWDQGLTDAFRSVGNALGHVPDFADVWPTWQQMDGLQHELHPDLQGGSTAQEEAAAIVELINDAKPHVKALKKRLAA